MGDEPIRIRTYYFADFDPFGKSLDEFLLASGPNAKGDLQVWQCLEAGVFSEELCLVVYEEGAAIQGGDGNFHQASLCTLLNEDDLENIDWDDLSEGYVVDLPQELVGTQTYVVDHFDDDSLDLLRLSINMARADHDDGGEADDQKTSRGKGSLWSRLGQLSKRIF